MKRLSLVAGALVVHEGRTYQIVEAVDMSTVLARPLVGGSATRIRVTELAPVSHAASSTALTAKDSETSLELDLDGNRTPIKPHVDLVHLDPEDVAIARKRYEAIGLLAARLQAGLMLSKADVADVAIAANVHT